jgi:hypothetical protein
MHMSLTLDAAIANTIHCIMDCVPLLSLMTRLPCVVLSHFFLPVRLGGDDLLWTYDAQRCS